LDGRFEALREGILPDARTPEPARILAQLRRIPYIPIVVAIGLEPTDNHERRKAMKLGQAVQVYQEYHRMNSGKKWIDLY
jgi:hypothetical protein